MSVLAALAANWRIVVIAAAVAAAAYYKGEALDAQLATQEAKNAAVQFELDLQLAHNKHAAALAKRERDHATVQQEKEDRYAADRLDFEKRIAGERAAVASLRTDLAKATARVNAGDSTDPVACERAFNRHEELGQLAGEGVGLLQEARELLQERDRDIQRLWEQLTDDRKAIGQGV